MVVGGWDIGSTTGKAVVMIDGEIKGEAIVSCTNDPGLTARLAMEEALKKAGVSSINDLAHVVGTGYGRLKVPFASDNISEISCHARGAHWICKTVRTIIDIGGQDVKVILVNDQGKVVEFAMNDRCAAGTGRFFESMARVLGCGLEGFSSSAISETPVRVTSQCSVFAESEVVTLINEGNKLPDIIGGINNSVAARLVSMVRRMGLIEDVALTGGCSKNQGLIKAVERTLGVDVKKFSIDPQLIGAIGAALFAQQKLNV